MFMLPSPLHPVLVHFPIVLLLLGVPAAVVAVFIRKSCLAWLAAGLLGCGALGSVAAVWSGEEEGETVSKESVAVEQALDRHQDWAERTRAIALLAAGLAVTAALLGRRPAARIFAVLTTLAAVAAAGAVARTGHEGGQLVYRHGIGINTPASTAVPAAGEHGRPDRD